MRSRNPASDATLQLLEFAELGRLRTPDDVPDMAPAPLRIVVASSVGLGLGITVAALATAGSDIAGFVMGAGVIAAALAVLIPALDGLREQRRIARSVRVEQATYRPVDTLQRGHWISQDGTWVRIDQAGVIGGGARSALLSNGEVIDLRGPVLVAAGRFEPEPQEHLAP